VSRSDGQQHLFAVQYRPKHELRGRALALSNEFAAPGGTPPRLLDTL
jgi:hypothetical protein